MSETTAAPLGSHWVPRFSLGDRAVHPLPRRRELVTPPDAKLPRAKSLRARCRARSLAKARNAAIDQATKVIEGMLGTPLETGCHCGQCIHAGQALEKLRALKVGP